MTAMPARLRALFLDPATPAKDARRNGGEALTAPAPATLAVLCPGHLAPAAGAIAALAAAEAGRRRCAAVCTWTGGEPPGVEASAAGLALPAARRLAVRLEVRDVCAAARGRLVLVGLPADPEAARTVVERVAATAGEAAVVTVVAGPRSPALDPLLGAQDRVLVVPPEGDLHALGGLALDEAARVARAVGVLRVPALGAGRLALRAGLVLPGSARRAALAALAGDIDLGPDG